MPSPFLSIMTMSELRSAWGTSEPWKSATESGNLQAHLLAGLFNLSLQFGLDTFRHSNGSVWKRLYKFMQRKFEYHGTFIRTNVKGTSKNWFFRREWAKSRMTRLKSRNPRRRSHCYVEDDFDSKTPSADFAAARSQKEFLEVSTISWLRRNVFFPSKFPYN